MLTILLKNYLCNTYGTIDQNTTINVVKEDPLCKEVFISESFVKHYLSGAGVLPNDVFNKLNFFMKYLLALI